MKIAVFKTAVLTVLSFYSALVLAFDYFVVKDDAAVYSAPNDEQPLTYLNKGNVLLKIDTQGTWSKVFFLSPQRQPLKGWMLSDQLTAQRQQEQSHSLPITGQTLRVSASQLRLRQGPGINYAVVGRLTRDQQVTERSRQRDWVKVAYRSASGETLVAWVASRFLRSIEPVLIEQTVAKNGRVEQTLGDYQVAGVNVNLRTGPGSGFSVEGKLSAPHRVEVIARQQGWLKIRTQRDDRTVTGWMIERFLTPVK